MAYHSYQHSLLSTFDQIIFKIDVCVRKRCDKRFCVKISQKLFRVTS